MIEKLFRIVPTKVKLSDEIALVLHIIMAGVGVFGIFYLFNHYHTTLKEIAIIIFSVNFIDALFDYLSESLKNRINSE